MASRWQQMFLLEKLLEGKTHQQSLLAKRNLLSACYRALTKVLKQEPFLSGSSWQDTVEVQGELFPQSLLKGKYR